MPNTKDLVYIQHLTKKLQDLASHIIVGVGSDDEEARLLQQLCDLGAQLNKEVTKLRNAHQLK